MKKTSKLKNIREKNKTNKNRKITMKGGYNQPFLYTHTAPPYNYVDNIGSVGSPIPASGYNSFTNLITKGGSKRKREKKRKSESERKYKSERYFTIYSRRRSNTREYINSPTNTFNIKNHTTIITDSNIHDFVQKYINNKNDLPPEMQSISINDWHVDIVTNMKELFTPLKI
jgi:hypothetical protein